MGVDQGCCGLCGLLDAADVVPRLEGACPLGAVVGCRHQMVGREEEVVDLIMGGQEALSLSGRLEPLHLAFSSPCWLVRVFRPIVEALVLAVLDARHDLLFGRAVGAQLIRDHDPRSSALPLQQLAEQAFGCLLVAPALNQNVHHDAVLIHSAPQIMLRAGDLEDAFIHMPLVVGPGQPPADDVGELLAKLEGPLPDRLVADHDAPESQHLLDHPKAERKAIV